MTMNCLSLDERIAQARAELNRLRTKRAQARVQHEQLKESVIRQARHFEQMLRKRQRSTMALHSQYVAAMQGEGTSPYIIRKQAFLLQALHQTEVSVKQLHLAREQSSSLAESITAAARQMKAENDTIEDTLLLECHNIAATMNKLEGIFKTTLFSQRTKIAEMTPVDEDTVVSEDSLGSIPWEPDPLQPESTLGPSLSALVSGFGGFFNRRRKNLKAREAMVLVPPALSAGQPTLVTVCA